MFIELQILGEHRHSAAHGGCDRHSQRVTVLDVRDVGQVAGQQVVDADDGVAAVEQRIGEMGADEAGGSGDDDAFLHGVLCGGKVSAPGAAKTGRARPSAR